MGAREAAPQQCCGVSHTKLTPHELREVAARAFCDPRTVRAYLDGRSQHSTTVARIQRAIRELRSEPATLPLRKATR